MVHSSIAGIVFYAWAQRRRLPSGRTKRRLLTVLLVLPLITAAVPGRGSVAFRERLAWLDSRPVLAIPLFWGLRVRDAVVAAAAMMVAVTIGQELLPVLRRRRPLLDAPESLVQFARRLPGWQECQVMLAPGDEVALATGGRPGRPRLIVSRGALARLPEDQLDIVLRHENAHWQGGRWIRAHVLFLVRLVQCFNPVALLAFREYCLELEIECDAAAVAGRDARLLVRTLLTIYETTAPRDIAARSALRKRADILLGDSPLDDDALPTPTLVAAAGILLVVLPWLV